MPKVLLHSSLLIAVFSAPSSAQEVNFSPSEDIEENAIVVTAERIKEEKAVKQIAKTVTRPQRGGKPLAKFYDPICPSLYGMKSDYGRFLLQLVQDRVEELGLPVGKEGCKPNALIAFQTNVEQSFEQLKDEQPWVFDRFLKYEIDRIENGSKYVRAWNVVDTRGEDGKVFSADESPQGREFAINKDQQVGRISQPIRRDMLLSVVVIQSNAIAGKSLQQIADYAVMRITTQTYDDPQTTSGSIPTILSLFTAPETAPQSMTPFDKAYVKALYKLPNFAKDNQILDATATAYFEQLKADNLPDP